MHAEASGVAVLLLSSYFTADFCRVPAVQPLAVLWMRTFAKHFTFPELLCFKEVCWQLWSCQECDAASLPWS